ncbi:MAG: hypothetical protein JWN32_3690, partial [Solirubrobacterales bacterium]|nr:hypothetical protein [Solirubrobacterales bacterium]
MVRPSRFRRFVVLLVASACGVIAMAPSSGSAHPSGRHGHESGLQVSAANGSDDNPCTAAAPCKTVGRAVGLAQPGDAVAVGPGSYPESVTIDKRLRLIGRDATIDASGKLNGIVV